MKICVIGSGPAGFYLTERLLKYKRSTKINLIESRYSPFGLIRFGVAPDHPEVKNCIHKFTKILQDENVRFFGGLRVGSDISVNFLKETHDAIVFCTGVENARTLNIPGHLSENVFSSQQFVGWYNNDPNIHLKDIDLSKVHDALIIGNGNVALDVARILLKPYDELSLTDISRNALNELKNAAIKNLRICARRGLEQTSFSVKELKELLALDIKVKVNSKENSDLLKSQDIRERRISRIMKLLWDNQNCSGLNFDKNCMLEYNVLPVKINADNCGKASSVDFLTDENKIINFPAQLIVTCIGYNKPNLLGIEYDSNGIIPNINGKMVDSKFPNCYAAGWAALGAKGNLASTLIHSHLVADKIMSDFKGFGEQCIKADFQAELMKAKIDFISKEDWCSIENYEHMQDIIGSNEAMKLFLKNIRL